MKRPSLFVFLILFIMIFTTAASIVAAEWMNGLSVIFVPAILGLIAGTALAFSNFPGWTAHVTSAIYGTFVIGVIGATHSTINQALEWRERALVLTDKVTGWFYAALNNGTSRDSVIFIVILCALFWLLGYTAAWYTFRHRRIWHVILPAGVTLFSNIYYYGGSAAIEIYLVIYLICALILLVESNLADREEQWWRDHVRFGGGLRWRATLAGLGIAVAALFVAVELPGVMQSPSAQEFFQQASPSYNEFMARWNRLFSTLRNYNLRPVDNYLPTVTLGGPRNLTADLVMQISAPAKYRYYWRAASYDTYDGINWGNVPRDTLELKANEPAPNPSDYIKRTDVQIQVALQRGTDALYTASVPKRAEVPSQAVLENNNSEITQLRLPVPLLPGNRFSSIGSLSTATIDELKQSKAAYPAWVQQRYLQVPRVVSPRVRDLARSIAGRFTSPYDRAKAIEAWLRQNIVYDENLDAPPAGKEAAEYVLFDVKRAYCTYYATSMVVMLRSLGVPSRLVTGYASGDMDLAGPDSPVADFTVRSRDSHVWVEVYFPEYGWVEFEPTAAQPEVDRQAIAEASLTPVPTPDPSVGSDAMEDEMERERRNRAEEDLAEGLRSSPLELALLDAYFAVRPHLPGILLLALILFVVFFGVRLLEAFGLGKLPPVQKAYGMLSRWASWLGVGPNNTPFEQAALMSDRAPGAADSVNTITSAYVEQRFSRKKSADAMKELDVLNAWRSARGELQKAWLRMRVGILNRRKRDETGE